MPNDVVSTLHERLAEMGDVLSDLLFGLYGERAGNALVIAGVFRPEARGLFFNRAVPGEQLLDRAVTLALFGDCLTLVTLAGLLGRPPIDWGRFKAVRPLLSRAASFYATAHPGYREFTALPPDRVTDFFNRFAASPDPFGLLHAATRFQGARLCGHAARLGRPELAGRYVAEVLLPLWRHCVGCVGVADGLAAQIEVDLHQLAGSGRGSEVIHLRIKNLASAPATSPGAFPAPPGSPGRSSRRGFPQRSGRAKAEPHPRLPMTATSDAVLRSWPTAPWLWAGLFAAAAVYLRGWLALRPRAPHRWTVGRLAAYLGGLLALFGALGSPLETNAFLSLQAHMAQHVLLFMFAPPLLWLAAPLLPVLRGLPGPVRRHWAAPLLRWQPLRTLFARLTHPGPALLLFVVVGWFWHLPAMYAVALRDDVWHYAQHASFLAAGLLFWYPVVRPYPARPGWPEWLLIPYLLLADLQNTALAALLTFADAPLYAHYAGLPPLGGVTPLDDQAAAGVLMWVPGSVAYLVPLFAVSLHQLGLRPTRPPAPPRGRVPLPLVAPAPEADLLRLPVVGRLLRWRHLRLAVQLLLFALAGVVVADGLWGPPVTPLNLAGVLPWVHWRGLLVLGLLVVGNVFCLGCPFLLPRTLARRWLPAGRAWPRWLRHKWLAVGLLVLFLWAYEAFALWDRPRLTAGLVVGYFAAAFAVDAAFRGASFCKYVCPIGQFNFLQSLVSPAEIAVRDPAVCAACRTKDCIRGGPSGPGCELALFVPRKVGNMDCTLCLDCVHACPHDNIALAGRVPGAELCDDPHRAGVGRFGRRADLAALALVFAFGAFANAAGMVAPVVDWQGRLGDRLGLTAGWPAVTLCYLALLVLVPAVVLTTAWLSRRLGGLADGPVPVACRFSFTLVPLGAAMWLAHYCFHLFTSYDAVVPAAERAAADLGWLAAAPDWVCSCCAATPGWLLRLEVVCLGVGLLLSLYAGWRLSGERWRVHLPWAVLAAALFALGVWLLGEPMQMRGTLALGG